MIGGDTGTLWALNATTGENLWAFKTCSQYYVSAALPLFACFLLGARALANAGIAFSAWTTSSEPPSRAPTGRASFSPRRMGTSTS
eukprot:COSAG04_NODE_390_length_15167_cov_93.727900_15_plen_86_part_00